MVAKSDGNKRAEPPAPAKSIFPKADFPLGEFEGRFELRAPELTAAKPVTYKIFVRRSFSVLILFSGLGLLIGWGTRGWLQYRQERDTAGARRCGVAPSDRRRPQALPRLAVCFSAERR